MSEQANDSAAPEAAAVQRLTTQIGRYLKLLNITRHAVICANEACRIVVYNQGAERLFGYAAASMLNKPLLALLCPDFRRENRHRLDALSRIAHESSLGFTAEEIICKSRGGSRIPVDLSLSNSCISGQHLFTLIINDATERLEKTEQLSHLAEHDPLTRLPNRILLNDLMEAGLARADRQKRRLGVIYLDLDEFKPVNDRYGHETGDCLLQAIAARLTDTMRHSDTVSRIHGDEFIVFIEQIHDRTDAMAAAQKIHTALHNPFQVLGHNITTSASIGIALYPDHGRDPDTLVRNADHAMYQAKENGLGPQLYRDTAVS